MDIEKKLRDLGWSLPQPPKPIAAYIPCVRSGNLLVVSGQLPTRDGKLLAVGRVPSIVSLESAQQAAGQCAVNGLAILGGEIAGDWSRLVRVVRMGAFVQSDDGFYDQAKVANGASELLQQVLGDIGRHARSTIGVNAYRSTLLSRLSLSLKLSDKCLTDINLYSKLNKALPGGRKLAYSCAMQPLSVASNRSKVEEDSPENCARAVLDVTPAVVRLIRRLMLSHRTMGLSVSQFRTLALLGRNPNGSLSCVAENIGSSLPAASRMIGVLVAKKLVVRQDSKGDRRQLSLALTPRGAETFKVARELAQQHLAKKLETLDPQQRQSICSAMELLGGVFGTDARPTVAAQVSPNAATRPD